LANERSDQQRKKTQAQNHKMPASKLSRPSFSFDGNDDGLDGRYIDASSPCLKRKNGKIHHKDAAAPLLAPLTLPSFVSDSSLDEANKAFNTPTGLMRKRRRVIPPPFHRAAPTRKTVTFASDIFHIYEDDIEEDMIDDIWWSDPDLKGILKREGRLVMNIKLAAANANKNRQAAVDSPALSLKQSINEAFKNCADGPFSSATKFPLVKDLDYNDPSATTAAITTTTRGLERFLAPIMGAHRRMVVQNLLTMQQQMMHQDSRLKMQVLSTQYQHLSQVATNFATVMGQLDAAQVAVTADSS